MSINSGALTLKQDTTAALPLVQSAPQFRQTARREALNPSPQRRDAVTETNTAKAKTPVPEQPPPVQKLQNAQHEQAQSGRAIDVFA